MKITQSIPMALTAISVALSAASAMAGDAKAYINGNIYTADAKHRFVSHVVIQDGIFKYVGDNKAIATSFDKDIKIVDLKGKTIVPGLYDSHIHPIGAGEKLLFQCQIPGNASTDEILDIVKLCASNTPDDAWVVGAGWGAHVLTSKNMPTLDMLDKVSNGRAVMLTDFSHHTVWANSKAIAQSGMTIDSMASFGDLVIYDKTGQFSGFFLEGAGEAIHNAVPKRTPEQYQMAARTVVSELNKLGVIGAKDSYVYEKEYTTWKALDDKGELNLNVALSWGWPATEGTTLQDKIDKYEQTVRPSSGHLYADFAKLTLDGIPPMKTASMLEPYMHEHDEEPVTGSLTMSKQEMKDTLAYLDKQGYTTQVHAVGDNAARIVLDTVAYVRKANGDSGLRHEIAHACIVDPTDLPRFSELNVVPNFSPIFWYPSMIQDGLKMAIGKERAERNCAVKTLSESGAMPTGGSDWPVSADVNPWKAMESLITRKDPNGLRATETLWPEERINLLQALEIYTINGAKAQRRDDVAGSITVGKSADMLVLNQNVFEAKLSEIGETQVEKTIFEGKPVYINFEAEVRSTIEQYSASVFNADSENLKNMFHANAVMAGDLPDVHLNGTPAPFIKDVASRPSMASQGVNLISEITYLDVQGNTASVTLEEQNFFGNGRFVNYLSLIKEKGEWKIISKTFTHK